MEQILDIQQWESLVAPLAGISRGLWALIGAVSFALLCLCFARTVRSGRVTVRQTFIEAGRIVLWSVGLFVLGLVLLPLFARAARIWQLTFLIGAGIGVTGLLVFVYLRRKKRFADRVSANAIRRSAAGSGAGKYARALLFGGLIVLTVSTIVCLLIRNQSVPAAVAVLAILAVILLLAMLTGWRLWYALGALVSLAALVLLAILSALLAGALSESTPLVFWAFFPFIPVVLSLLLPMLTLTFLKK